MRKMEVSNNSDTWQELIILTQKYDDFKQDGQMIWNKKYSMNIKPKK